VMTPEGNTKFEYSDTAGGVFTPYVHALAAVAAVRAQGATWRLPATDLRIAPGATTRYAFRFQWAKDVTGVRDVLYREGKFDTAVAPGMVVPADLPAMISLRSRNTIAAVAPE